MPRLLGIKYQGIPLPPLRVPPGLTRAEQDAFAEQALNDKLEKDPTFVDRHIKSLGLSAEDVDYLSQGTYEPATPETAPVSQSEAGAFGTGRGHQAETSDIPWYGRLQTGASRFGDKFQNGITQILSNPALVNAAANAQGINEEQLQKMGVTPENLQRAQDAIKVREAEQRREYEALDDDTGILGSTVGLEDVGEAIPEALAMVGPSGKLGLLKQALQASLVAGAQGVTTEEDRLEQMLFAGAFGLAVPGAMQGGIRLGTAALTQFGGRLALAMAGTISGLGGMGRATSMIARLGGIARREQTDVAVALEAQQLMQDAAKQLRPAIEGMTSFQTNSMVKAAFRQDMLNWWQESVIPEMGAKGGMDIARFLTKIDGYADSRLRTLLGSKWGDMVNAWRSDFQTVAPQLSRLMKDPVLRQIAGLGRTDKGLGWDLINGMIEFFGGGTYQTLRHTLSASDRQRVLENQLARLVNTIFAQRPDNVSNQDWERAQQRLTRLGLSQDTQEAIGETVGR